MKKTPIILSILFAFVGAAEADTVPKRSRDFTGNYQNLVKEQHASPQVADCIASGYDFVKKHKKYDRLGFTADDISDVEINEKSGKFSTKDPRTVSAVIAVPGEARIKSVGYKWDGVVLRCGITNGKLKAIELVQTKAAK